MLSILNLSYKLNDYKLILINIAVISIVAAILLILNYFIRQKSNKMIVDQNKLAAYECGFEPFSEMHAHSVDVQFFLVSIMFLIFDIELALMFP
jgi:NADH-quinone oxidoreductase subunit A